MASHIFIVASVVMITCLVISTHAAAPTAPLTLETCGVTRPCGINDTFQVLCPGSPTCTDFFKCKEGVATVERCERPAWYVFWLAPFYNTAKKCCDFAVKLCSSVHPDSNGRCPAPIDLSEVTEDEEKNVQVKRHALTEGQKNETVSSAEPSDAKEDEPKTETEQELKTGESDESEKPQDAEAQATEEGETHLTKEKAASSANGLSIPFLAIAAAGFFTLGRH